MIRGRLLYADTQQLWLAQGSVIMISRDGGNSWQDYGTIPAGVIGKLKASTRLGRRLTRAGIHHVVPGNPTIACMNDGLYRRAEDSRHFSRVSSLTGSRPLAFATDGNLVCYGEYRGNAERGAVHVWGATTGCESWEPVHTFTDVRHIHGVFFDPYTESFWVTTGDDDEESGIFQTFDRFGTLNKVAGGNQQLRAVQLLFTEQYVYYGSDTPIDKNYIYRMERISGRIECLQAVGSSVFYGCKVGDALFFSTAVEPSDINRTDAAELWCSLDGENWSLLRTFEKDRLSLRYFQYGQVLFPAGPGDDAHLYYTPFATEGDQKTFSLTLTEVAQELSGSDPRRTLGAR